MLYKVELNWMGDGYVFHKHASSSKQARVYAIRSLEEKFGRERGSMWGHFEEGERCRVSEVSPHQHPHKKGKEG